MAVAYRRQVRFRRILRRHESNMYIHFSQESLLSRLTYPLIEHECMLIWTNSQSKTQALCCSLKRFCPTHWIQTCYTQVLWSDAFSMLVVGERLSRSRYITNLYCFSGTWHIFSPVFFSLHFSGFAPSKQNILNHSHSLLAQQIHYIFKRPFPTYRWAWNRWVITWPVTSLPYCYLLTSDSFGKPHARSQHGLLSRWFE